MMNYHLSDLFEKPISGEWGTEQGVENEDTVGVLRTTNFSKNILMKTDSTIVQRVIEQKKIDKKRLLYGDIIIEKSGGSPAQPVGRVLYYDLENENNLCNNFTSILRTKEGFESKYLAYLLQNLYDKRQVLKFQNKTTGIINLKLDRYLTCTKIPLPSLPIQKKIVRVLDKAQQLIDLREKQILHLDELKRSVYLTTVGPNSDHYRNWHPQKIRDIVKKEKNSIRTGPFGSDLRHSEFVEAGISVLGIDNVVKNKFEWTKKRFITKQKFSKLKRYQVFPDDILISIMGTTGRTAVVPYGIPISINTKHLACLTPDKNIVNPHYLSFAIHSDPIILNQIRKQNKGAIMDGLNLTIIKGLEINLPPIYCQNDFADKIQKIESQKVLMQESLVEMKNNYYSLMQRAFKGDLFSE